MNHCISFSWASLDNVEGFHSLSIHLLPAASSAKAGAVTADDAAINANTLVIINIFVLLAGPLLISKFRMVVPPLQRQTYSGPGSSRIWFFSFPSNGAKYCNRRSKRNQGGEPKARQFNSFSDRQRRERVGANEADPQQMDDGRHYQ